MQAGLDTTAACIVGNAVPGAAELGSAAVRSCPDTAGLHTAGTAWQSGSSVLPLFVAWIDGRRVGRLQAAESIGEIPVLK